MTLNAALFILASGFGGLVLIWKGWQLYRAEPAPAEATISADALLAEITAALDERLARAAAEQDRRMAEAIAAAVRTAPPEAPVATLAETVKADLDALRQDLTCIKSDLEWLAGERMIEQAIALANSGTGPEEIGRELGLATDTARTIALFRKH